MNETETVPALRHAVREHNYNKHRMISLYQRGSGSSECQVIRPAAPQESWAKLRTTAIRLLQAKGCERAASLLETEGFELFESTNGFNDEFFALTKNARIEAYADYGVKAGDEEFTSACRSMALVFDDLGFFVRFVVVELDNETDVTPVATPVAAAPVEVVKRALRDAEHLLATSGAVSAIDRAHTALHGYLKWVCQQAGNLPATKDPGITELMKHAESHPKFGVSAVHSDKITRILRAFASALDAINQVRNRGSLAHPNEHLLDDADAMLVVNAARTMLRYLDDRLK